MSEPHPTIRPQPGILQIAPYQGGDSVLAGFGPAHGAGERAVLKLSSNENPFGPSPLAVEAFREAAASLHLYPDTSHARLRAAIAEAHGLDAERVICGAGSDEVIALLAQCYAGPGLDVIHTEHAFGMYRIAALAAGARPVEVREAARRTDVDAILAAASARTALVFIANPNNPTGTMIAAGEVERLAGGLPERTLLVLDGAYAEYVPGFDGHAGLVEARQNVVMTRTFSKMHGLGGLRVGWGYGPAHVMRALGRLRGPFNLSTAQLAAAEAALRDAGHAARCLAANTASRARLAHGLAALGIACDPSQANFVLARFSSRAAAEAGDAALRARGIIVRKMAGYNLPEALRITVGDAAAVERVLAARGDPAGARA
ncbi:histidinol-phosphate transaminase [soil metagenome]